MDKGHVFYRQRVRGNDYEFVAYCDKCDAGRSQHYDGRILDKKHERNPYYTPPISQILDANEIGRENKEKYKKDHSEASNLEMLKKKEVLSRPW